MKKEGGERKKGDRRGEGESIEQRKEEREQTRERGDSRVDKRERRVDRRELLEEYGGEMREERIKEI